MSINIDTDSDTLRLLEIVAHFRQQYFAYSEDTAIEYLEQYYTNA